MNLYKVFGEQISRQPDAVAIVDAKTQRRWSYGEIDDASANMAARLAAAGLRPGDGVILLIPMSIHLYVTLLACLRLGLAAMLIDPSAGRAHIEQCCRLYPPSAFIGVPGAHLLRLLVPAVRRIRRRFSTSRLVPGAACLPLDTRRVEAAPPIEVAAAHPALVSFTSGSTGRPRVALRSHGFLLEQHRVISRNQVEMAGKSSLTLFPAFVLSNLAAGITTILADVDLRHPQRIDAARLYRAWRRYRPDSLGLQPVVMARLIDYCQRSGSRLEGDFVVYSGGAPVFPALLERFRQIAPRARLFSVYGSTEAEPIAVAEFGAQPVGDCTRCKQGLLAGRPVPEIELRIVRIGEDEAGCELSREEFEAMCLQNGAIGEIVVSGNHVLESYLDVEAERANKYRVGGDSWHRTGDAGSIDAEGRLWLAGRCAARIEDRRGTGFPLGVEATLAEFPEISRSALIGHRGRRLLAIECRPGQHAAVEDRVRNSAVGSEFDELRFFTSLPVDRRHNGKIDYPRLRELLAAS